MTRLTTTLGRWGLGAAALLLAAGEAAAQGNGNRFGWCQGTHNPHNGACGLTVPPNPQALTGTRQQPPTSNQIPPPTTQQPPQPPPRWP